MALSAESRALLASLRLALDSLPVRAIRGRLGEFVCKTYGRKIVVTRAPSFAGYVPSAAQRTRRDQMREATSYAQRVYAEPAAKAFYVAAAKKLRRQPFRLAVSDYLTGHARVAKVALARVPIDRAQRGVGRGVDVNGRFEPVGRRGPRAGSPQPSMPEHDAFHALSFDRRALHRRGARRRDRIGFAVRSRARRVGQADALHNHATRAGFLAARSRFGVACDAGGHPMGHSATGRAGWFWQNTVLSAPHMNTPRRSFRRLFRVAAPGVVALVAALNGAAYGAPNPSLLRESVRQGLVAASPLPPGAEPDFRPLNQAALSLPRLEADPAKAEQRAQALTADLKTIVPAERLPAAGSSDFLTLRADALAIVKRWYQESRDALEPDAVGELTRLVTWTPDFSAAPRIVSAADRDRASQASYSVAYAVTHLERPRFVVAYAAAIVALNPDGALEAGNAASALVTSGERLYGAAASDAKLAACRGEAAIVYRYALACSVVDGKWTLRSLGILINLGNLYVDMKSPERARPVLLAARAFAPNSWDAALGLASCYLLQGNAELARAALEDKSVKRSAIYAEIAKGSAQLEAISSAGELLPEASEEEFDGALKTFEGKETLTAADFVDAIDPQERDRMRRFVDTLPVSGSYRAPPINGLTQFSSLKSISTPLGFRALGDFHERLGAHYLPLMGHMMVAQTEMLARMGFNVKLNVDINDVFRHPERYKDANIDIQVTGIDEFKARVSAMKAQAEQMKANLQSGNMSAVLQSPMANIAGPGLAIHLLKPFDYANPMDVLIQQYNVSVLAQKSHAYITSFLATNRRTRAALNEIRDRHERNRAEIREREKLELAMFEKKKAEAERAGVDTNTAEWKIMKHNIHTRFMTEYNSRAEYEWKEATQVAAKAYADKIKPRAERFYYDVFRHIALISDPEVREKKNRDFEEMLIFGVSQGLENVLGAFGSMPYVQEWDCHCNLGSLLAQADQEEKELEQIRREQEEREMRERLRFESGEVPPASPLFAKLDAYGADLNIPFIPLLGGRVSCARSTLTLAAEFPTALSAKGRYTFTESAFTGATTHAAGLEISVSGEEGSLSGGATLNVQGSISLDGHGTVTDYTVTGAGSVNVGLGPVSGTIGAEVGYTRKGGLTSDLSGGLTGVLQGAYGRSTNVTIEGSARRGSTLSVQAEQNLNPYSGEINTFLKDVSKDSIGDKFPFSTSVKKEIWNGRFVL